MTFEEWWSEKYDTPQPNNPDGTPSETGYFTPSRKTLQDKRLMLKGWKGREKDFEDVSEQLKEARNIIEQYAGLKNSGNKARKYLEEIQNDQRNIK